MMVDKRAIVPVSRVVFASVLVVGVFATAWWSTKRETATHEAALRAALHPESECVPYPPPGTYVVHRWTDLQTQFPGNWRMCPGEQPVVKIEPEAWVDVTRQQCERESGHEWGRAPNPPPDTFERYWKCMNDAGVSP